MNYKKVKDYSVLTIIGIAICFCGLLFWWLLGKLMWAAYYAGFQM